MLWAALHLPQLALDAVLRRLEDRQRPLLLSEQQHQRPCVLAANASARAAGIGPGQTLAQAQALCPTVRVLAHDPSAARALRQLLCAWAYGYSSLVCHDDASTLWLEVGGSLGLFGPWPALQQRLRAELAELAVEHRIALAPTAAAAELLARASDGLAVLERERLAAVLGPLPLAESPLPEEQIEALAGMGVRRLQQLLALPRAALSRRFGPGLAGWLERLLGLAADPRQGYHPPDRFQARCEFDQEISEHTALLFPLRHLLDDLARYLRQRDGGVQQFELQFEHDGRPPHRQPVGLLQPERDPARLFELARLSLERLQLAAPVRALGVLAEQLPAFVPLARDLFDPRPASALDWPALQARLAARLGEDACRQLETVADPRPEYAQRISRRPRVAEGPVLPRPAWLLPRPLPLRETPARILAGPERIESGWWDGHDLRRDYYVIETAGGQRAWVFCPPGECGPFMLQGWFA